MTKGSYVLVIRLKKPLKIMIRHRQYVLDDKAVYLYIGSAVGRSTSLENRISRHLRISGKRKHWHIDSITMDQDSEVTDVFLAVSDDNLECDITKKILESLQARASAPIPGFGASDCKRKCPAHLLKITGSKQKIQEVVLKCISKLGAHARHLSFHLTEQRKRVDDGIVRRQDTRN
ncbi:MAG: GIY-YIG nuclease family protein [Candidatus Ranarchaeia archaeon]